jgi:hypothetical protein
MIYELAKHQQTHDQAQRDDSMRLAHVAHKSRKKYYWFVQPRIYGAARLVENTSKDMRDD